MSVNGAELLTRAPEYPSPGRGADGAKPARSRPRVVILASGIGLNNRGVGQYERYLLPHLLPLLVAGGCDVSVVLSRDAALSSPGEGVQYLRLPAAQRKQRAAAARRATLYSLCHLGGGLLPVARLGVPPGAY